MSDGQGTFISPPSYTHIYSLGSPIYVPASSPSSTSANATDLELRYPDDSLTCRGPYNSTSHYYAGASRDPLTGPRSSSGSSSPHLTRINIANLVHPDIPAVPVRILDPSRPTRLLPIRALPAPPRTPTPVPPRVAKKPSPLMRASNGIREVEEAQPGSSTSLELPAPPSPPSWPAALSPIPSPPPRPRHSPLWDCPHKVAWDRLEKFIQCAQMNQHNWETIHHKPHTHLPGTALLCQYPRGFTSPIHFIGSLQPWHSVFRARNNTQCAGAPVPGTPPVHLEVIPYSPNYKQIPEDLFLRFIAVIRQLLESVLKSVLALCDQTDGVCDAVFVRAYDEAVSVREQYTNGHRIPETCTTIHPPKGVIYLGDRKDAAHGFHPLLHKFEVDFLCRASLELKIANPNSRFHVLQSWIYGFLEMPCVYSWELSALFLTGKLVLFQPKTF
ncbi:hypothetical protein C8J57DRAFT_1540508 [Mycena rebaudengoi]|nr:hypothetical protein C8J57DRAFT_1540508 [Mycena rebaudengoi]